MINVQLEGFLGEKYGRDWNVKASSYKEVFDCIEANYPGLREDLIDFYHAGGDLSIVSGGDLMLSADEMFYPIDVDTIIITPVPTGSKSGGAKILAAIAIVTLMFVLMPVTATLSAGFAAGATGTQLAAAIATASMLSIGINLAIAGIQQLLAPDPSVDDTEDDYLFSGPQGVVVSGNPVPVLFGEMIIGGIIMSAGIIPGLASSYGHVTGVIPGLGGIGGLPGGSFGGDGGGYIGDFYDGRTIVEGESDNIDPSLILYSSNTIKAPWAARAPAGGVSYLSPVISHEVPEALHDAHKLAISYDKYKDETDWNNFEEIVVGVLPATATLYRVLEGVGISSEASVSALDTNATLAATLEGIGLVAEVDSGFVAGVTATLADIGFSSVASASGASEKTASLAATLDDIGLSTTATAPYINTLAGTLDGIGISAVATAPYISVLDKTLDSIGISSAATFTSGASRTVPVISSSAQGAGGTANVTKPTGTAEGDLLVGFFWDFIDATTITMPAGWTQVGSTLVGSELTLKVGYKVAGASEPASYDHTSSADSYPTSFMARITNYDGSEIVGASAPNTGTGTSRVTSSLTAPYVNSLLLVWSCAGGDYLEHTAGMSGMTVVQDFFDFTALYSENIAASGATGTRSQPSAADGAYSTFSLLINGAT